MKLDKAYTINELENVLDAECISNGNKLFDTISTITNPIKGSLGFLTSDNNYDLSQFAGLIVDISFSRDIKKTYYYLGPKMYLNLYPNYFIESIKAVNTNY